MENWKKWKFKSTNRVGPNIVHVNLAYDFVYFHIGTQIHVGWGYLRRCLLVYLPTFPVLECHVMGHCISHKKK